MKLEITSCLLRKLHLIIYLYTSFYFPVAKGTTLGVIQDLKYVFAPGNGVFFLFSFFCSFLFLGKWLLSEHAQFMPVPVEMNSAAIQTLFHVFQTHMRILSSLEK